MRFNKQVSNPLLHQATSRRSLSSSISKSKLFRSQLGPDFAKRLAEYQSVTNRPCFALLKVGGEVVEDELKELTETTAFLVENGLLPTIVHGGGPQMNKELAKRGVKPQYVKGNRVTDDATLAVAEKVFTELNARIVHSLKEAGVKSTGFASGVFESVISSPELGFVGKVVGVKKEKVFDALKNGTVPVLTSLGFSSDHPALNINADVAARELAIAIKPQRVVYTSSKGGWIDDHTGKVLPFVAMDRDYAKLAGLNYEGRQGTLLKLNEIKALLDDLPGDSAVAISSAVGILSELFSSPASNGTTFVKGGVTVNRFDSFAQLDFARLQKLLPTQMHTLPPDSVAGVYCDNDYSSAAVVEKRGGNFFVSLSPSRAPKTLALEHAMWSAIEKDFPSVAWRINNVPMSNLEVVKSRVIVNSGGAMFGGSNESICRAVAGGTVDQPKGDAERKSKERKRRVKVGLLGARGFVGRELVKLVANHAELDLCLASSRALVGKSVGKEFGCAAFDDLVFTTLEGGDVGDSKLAKDIDVWVLALPNGLAPKWVAPLTAIGKAGNKNTGALLIDLGADFRFDAEWAYGLAERKGARELIRGKRRISNPGCYATAAQVALMPLVPNLKKGDVPTVFGVSGYSGAGTSPSDKNDPKVLRDNILPYASVKHMHERECTRHLNTRIAFMPHVASYFQGIAVTTSCHVEGFSSASEIESAFKQYYAGEKLVKVMKEAPKVRDNMNQHFVAVGGIAYDAENKRVAIHSTIDNLLKGAATQCMQNINIALGFDEYEGIL